MKTDKTNSPFIRVHPCASVAIPVFLPGAR
jgi:hypothetical protein